jgi:hypothetical protein
VVQFQVSGSDLPSSRVWPRLLFNWFLGIGSWLMVLVRPPEKCPKLGLFCPIPGQCLIFSTTWWVCFHKKTLHNLSWNPSNPSIPAPETEPRRPQNSSFQADPAAQHLCLSPRREPGLVAAYAIRHGAFFHDSLLLASCYCSRLPSRCRGISTPVLAYSKPE